MKIVTWNINSVRLRINLLLYFIEQNNPDIICLQETKTPDEFFPENILYAQGYTHIYKNGMKSYNGVAILSKIPLFNICIQNMCKKQDCRHLMATTIDDIDIHCIYAPAGGDIPDPVHNEKFKHKLDFYKELTDYFRNNRKTRKILVGDLNIAPQENDVWSHKQMLKVVSHTPIEIDHMKNLQHSANWIDAPRLFTPPTDKLYSWWSYRAKDWQKSNRGRRLDHIWTTPDLETIIHSVETFYAMRGQSQPSDHVPIMMELKI